MGFVKTTTSGKTTDHLQCWIPQNPNTINPFLNVWVPECVCVCVANPRWLVATRSIKTRDQNFILDSNSSPTYTGGVVTV